jgi:hypothetical protein
LRGHASRKYHAESPKHLLCAAWFHPAWIAVCGLTPSCMNHRVCNDKPVSRRRGTKASHNMLK